MWAAYFLYIYGMEPEKRCETCKYGSKVMYGQVLCYVNYKFESKLYFCDKWKRKEKDDGERLPSGGIL